MKRNFLKNLSTIMSIGIVVFGISNVYAAEVPVLEVYKPYSISSKGNTNLAIDVPFNDPKNNLNLFTKDLNKQNQRWMLGRFNSYVWVYSNLTVGTNQQMVMSKTSENNIKLVSEYGASQSWSSIDFHSLGNSYYRMYFPHLGKYLGVRSASTWQNLEVQSYSEDSNCQKWYVEI